MGKLRVLDLFSGVGGFALGLERTGGFQTVLFCEKSPFCRRVLAKHWPDVPIHNDIKKLNGGSVEGIDVICGGFPCQQTSLASSAYNKRQGLAGPDSKLWWECLRVIREVRPVGVIVENPPGVPSWADTIVDGLAGAGYGISVLQCALSDFGGLNLRRRVFFVANRPGAVLERTGKRSKEITNGKWADPGRDFWREVEPGVLRMDAGFPSRVDRIRSLGNSAAPAQTEWVGRQFLKILAGGPTEPRQLPLI